MKDVPGRRGPLGGGGGGQPTGWQRPHLDGTCSFIAIIDYAHTHCRVGMGAIAQRWVRDCPESRTHGQAVEGTTQTHTQTHIHVN